MNKWSKLIRSRLNYILYKWHRVRHSTRLLSNKNTRQVRPRLPLHQEPSENVCEYLQKSNESDSFHCQYSPVLPPYCPLYCQRREYLSTSESLGEIWHYLQRKKKLIREKLNKSLHISPFYDKMHNCLPPHSHAMRCFSSLIIGKVCTWDASDNHHKQLPNEHHIRKYHSTPHRKTLNSFALIRKYNLFANACVIHW